ncbi:cytochrome c [Demequina sp. TTPB684]|uniref:cytochrome bc1 complex diheme cytochrome c subunit n=1 Tax=unclassified Demequina TaxID=2620311 RepID=UPI001CF2DB95|nr:MULTISPECIES: c-type cytochrome [unclassified Demequina]MCB2413838.1 cytochrome c [Demequina sp. TTPB684]UPU89150.1 cytochrome c [Demequina sp. TMPB413]
MRTVALKRHHRAAPFVLLFVLLAGLTMAASFARSQPAQATVASEDAIQEGQKLFAANCATCHGLDAQGQVGVAPSLVGVGAASVDFQVGTGRMPMQASGPQAIAKDVQFNEEQIAQLAAFVASLGPGPSVPDAEAVDASLGDPANGMQLFRTNCAMCHGSVGGGGALSQGKYAPALWQTTPTHIYEAMLVGPQSMPVFNEANLTPEDKRDVIAFLEQQRDGSPGGLSLGTIGPVAEGLWAWLLGMGLIVAFTVWIGVRSS